MAVPKHRVTRSKRGMRRAHSALSQPTLTIDRRSGEMTLRHHVTESLYYRGKPVLLKLREARIERKRKRSAQQGEST